MYLYIHMQEITIVWQCDIHFSLCWSWMSCWIQLRGVLHQKTVHTVLQFHSQSCLILRVSGPLRICRKSRVKPWRCESCQGFFIFFEYTEIIEIWHMSPYIFFLQNGSASKIRPVRRWRPRRRTPKTKRWKTMAQMCLEVVSWEHRRVEKTDLWLGTWGVASRSGGVLCPSVFDIDMYLIVLVHESTTNSLKEFVWDPCGSIWCAPRFHVCFAGGIERGRRWGRRSRQVMVVAGRTFCNTCHEKSPWRQAQEFSKCKVLAFNLKVTLMNHSRSGQSTIHWTCH